MARKSIKGYAEKNYYDNTRFSGGIVATNDPLNEGYFKHMVNFNISDTGSSVEPRKGFFTTTFKINDVIYTLSDKTIYFYDANLGRHIFIDFLQTIDSKTPLIISADFDIENKYLTNAELITKFDWETLKDYNINNYRDISFLQDKAELAIDEYSINKYIIKAEYNDDGSYLPIWVSFVYRKNGSTYEGVTYEADTLVMEYLKFSDTVSINMADRNLASDQSIIPDPIQYVCPSDKPPLDFIQQFPLIYVKDSEDKYLINTTKKLDRLKFIPYFQLGNAKEGYDWYYTYDIVSTELSVNNLDSNNKFESSIFNLKNNKSIDSVLYKDPNGEELNVWYYQYIKRLLQNNSFKIDHNEINYSLNTSTNEHKKEYSDYLSTCDIINKNKYLRSLDDNIIIYMFPKHNKSIWECKDFSDFKNVFNNVYTSENFIDGKYDGDFIFKKGLSLNSTPTTTSIYFSADYTLPLKFEADTYISSKYNSTKDFLDTIKFNFDTDKFMFYIVNTNNISTEYFSASDIGFQFIPQTCINSRIMAFKENSVLTFSQLTETLHELNCESYILKGFTTSMIFNIDYVCTLGFSDELYKMFPNIKTLTNGDKTKYYICTNLNPFEFDLIHKQEQFSNFIDYNNYRINITYNRLFKEYYDYTKVKDASDVNTLTESEIFLKSYEPIIQQNFYYSNGTYIPFSEILKGINISEETFEDYNLFDTGKIEGLTNQNIWYYKDVILFGDLYNITSPNALHQYLINNNYYSNGISIIFYIFQAPTIQKVQGDLKDDYYFDRTYLINSTSLKSNKQIVLSYTQPTTMIEKLTEEPKLIANADNSLVFRSTQGDHLVVYINNKVFISEANKQYYFKYTKMFEYPETVVKVIQYKDTLLVFTTQNLYSIYPIEVTENVQSGTDEEGNATYTQVTTIAYGNLPVLYNLLVNEKYKDAIQVYNQMVLFYSADGQMFMIKPTATIDDNTRFSIQYFNKNANDILLNYNYYMQERLKYYRYDDLIIDKDKVNIKVSVSLNYIKIFYCAPGIMTYILVYDIINNRYYAYDTLSFTNIKQLEFVPDGELYIVEYNEQLYFTQPYVIPNEVNSNVDRAFYNNFAAESIHSELDTGILNLNNHLKKRFRDLHIIYKNLDAQNIEFALDVFVDNVPIALSINTEIEIKNVGIIPTYNPSDIYSVTQLVNKSKVELMSNNNALFDFSEFNSSKILTHKVSIISRGKHIRNKLCFKSEGKFKIQGYGLIYKEHTV